MAEEEPLIARIIGIAGKYHYLDVGKNDGVQVNDMFDDYELYALNDPEDASKKFKGIKAEDGTSHWAKAIIAELQVEVVFGDHCYAVLTYAANVPHFKVGDEVERGHQYRITASGSRVKP